MDNAQANVTQLLKAWSGGDQQALAELTPQVYRELRGGLSVEETAEVLKISPQSVLRDWKVARAWLLTELTRTHQQEKH